MLPESQSLLREFDQAENRDGRRTPRHRLLIELASSPKALLALLIMLAVLSCAMLSPLLAPYDPAAQSLIARLSPPFSTSPDGLFHIFGTDHLGRDILSRVIYGARISLVVGISAAFVAGTVGVLLGLVSGYVGGLVEDVIMRL